MEITAHSFWTLIHGMGFGALYLMACSGALMELYRRYTPATDGEQSKVDGGQSDRFFRMYLYAMAIVAWITVLTGTYLVYPWYRAAAPSSAASLAAYPQALLLSKPVTAGWHSLGMEWKEHVAWVVPISITMVAAVFARYGKQARFEPALRNALLGFLMVSFAAAGIAGFFGAMLNKNAPVEGGTTMHLLGGK